jgi:hypothetical protein
MAIHQPSANIRNEVAGPPFINNNAGNFTSDKRVMIFRAFTLLSASPANWNYYYGAAFRSASVSCRTLPPGYRGRMTTPGATPPISTKPLGTAAIVETLYDARRIWTGFSAHIATQRTQFI